MSQSPRPSGDCRVGNHGRCVIPALCSCTCHTRVARVPELKLTASTAAHAVPVLRMIATDEIAAGNNIRIEGDVGQLRNSIEQHGILQPITVVEQPDGTVECIFGHRRLAAARLACLPEVPCLVRPADTKQVRVLTQLAENRDRRDMTILEEARVYAQLRGLGMKQVEIATVVGVDPVHVSRRLSPLAYPEVVQQAVHQRNIGLNDALGIPLDLAQRADGRTLAAACRHGGAHLRRWVDSRTPSLPGQRLQRQVKGTLNLDARLIDRIRVHCKVQKTDIGGWLEKVLTEALDGGTG